MEETMRATAILLGVLVPILVACSDSNTGTPSKDTRPWKDDGQAKDQGASKEGSLAEPGAAETSPMPDHGVVKDASSKVDAAVPPAPEWGVLADGAAACAPSCCNIGSKSEGWCGCSGSLLNKPGTTTPYWDSCATCTALCKNCGSGCKSNGYYSSCAVTQVIEYATCTECKPKCDMIGSYSEGWYDTCTGKILTDPSTGNPFWDSCSKCSVTCTNNGPGSKTNGYYSTCTGTKLIEYVDCVP
jgi:hypothetical protein